jgi:hypothetical protein
LPNLSNQFICLPNNKNKNKLTLELKKQDHIISNSDSNDQNMDPIICSHDNNNNSDDPWLIRHQEKDGHWDSLKHEGSGTLELDLSKSSDQACLFNTSY